MTVNGEDHRIVLSQLIQVAQELLAAVAGGLNSGLPLPWLLKVKPITSIEDLGATAIVHPGFTPLSISSGEHLYIGGHSDPRDGDYQIVHTDAGGTEILLDHPLPSPMPAHPMMMVYERFPKHGELWASKPTAADLVGVSANGFIHNGSNFQPVERSYKSVVNRVRGIIEHLLQLGPMLRWCTDDSFETTYTTTSFDWQAGLETLLSAGSYGPEWVQFPSTNTVASTGVKWQSAVLMQLREALEKFRWYKANVFQQYYAYVSQNRTGDGSSTIPGAWASSLGATPVAGASLGVSGSVFSGPWPDDVEIFQAITQDVTWVLGWVPYAGHKRGGQFLLRESVVSRAHWTSPFSTGPQVIPVPAMIAHEDDGTVYMLNEALPLPGPQTWQYWLVEKPHTWFEFPECERSVMFTIDDDAPSDVGTRGIGRGSLITDPLDSTRFGPYYDTSVDEFLKFELAVDEHITYG